MAHIDQKKEFVVSQDNQVIEACYSMTLVEKRVLLLAISKIDSTKFPQSGTPLTVSLDVNEWAKYYPDENPWRALKRSTTSLLGRHVTFHPKTGLTEKVNWFARVTYHEDEGWLTLEFTRPMQVRLAGMLEQFTQVNLLSINQLRSVYSIRLYELLSQFKSTGYRAMVLDDFRFAMDCTDAYKTTKSLKQWIIRPAVKELNLKSDLIVEVEDIKRGRTITGFKFYFKENKQSDMFKIP